MGIANVEAQVYADQITVTAAGTDGYTTCCGPTPAIDGFSSSKRITSRALGVPQASDVRPTTASYNFYSLGFGGEVVVRMGNGFNNIAGADLQIHETTFFQLISFACSGPNPDRVRVWVSQDDCNFILIGDFCEQGPNPISISLPSYLPWARFVKLRDVTTNPNNSASAGQDGFDLDGLKGLSAKTSATPAGDLIYATSVMSFSQGRTKAGGLIPVAYSSAARALNTPQNSDIAGSALNYVSLGFGGSLTLEMDRLVFKRSVGGNEIRLVETSIGTPPCSSNPELATVHGSLNGTSWVLLGTVCQDGFVSIPASSLLSAGLDQYAIRYLRITDASNATSSIFSSSANGYDLDGVVATVACAGYDVDGFSCYDCLTTARMGELNEEAEFAHIQNESLGINLFPNPTDGIFTVNIPQINKGGVIRVLNISGMLIKEQRLMGNEENIQLSIEEFPAGFYLISYQDGERQFLGRIVKN